jgi:hypothetical protein
MPIFRYFEMQNPMAMTKHSRRRGAELSPVSALANFWVSWIFGLRGLHEDTDVIFEKVITADPALSEVFTFTGRSAFTEGDQEKRCPVRAGTQSSFLCPAVRTKRTGDRVPHKRKISGTSSGTLRVLDLSGGHKHRSLNRFIKKYTNIISKLAYNFAQMLAWKPF